MKNNNIKLLKKITLVLATSCSLCTISTVHSANNNNEIVNNIINENNNITNNILQNIPMNNENLNNNLNNDVNNNVNAMLAKKRKRRPYEKHNVTINYKDLNDANNTLKKLVLENKSHFQDKYDKCPNKDSSFAKSCLKKIQKLNEMNNKQFPILSLKKKDTFLLPTIDNYWHLNDVLKQVKLLKTKIRNKISYKKNNNKQLKLMLNKIQNGNDINKSLFKKLKNVGIIQNSRVRIRRYESAEALDTVAKQQTIMNRLYDIYNKIKESYIIICNIIKNKNKNLSIEDNNSIIHHKNSIKNNITKLYEILMDTNNIQLIFKHHIGVADCVPHRIENTINNMVPVFNNITKITNCGIGIDKTLVSLKLIKEDFIRGIYFDYDFSKRYRDNYDIIGKYYKEMLIKSDIFKKNMAHTVLKGDITINTLKKYNNTVSNSLINFIDTNNKLLESYWGKMISKNTIEGIVTKLAHNQLEEKSLTEILNIFKEKINNGSIPNDYDIVDFCELVLRNNQVLMKILQDDNIINLQILSNIFSNKYVKEFITKKLVKNLFRNAFYFTKTSFNMFNLLGYSISDKYNKFMEHCINRGSNIFLKLLGMKGILYINGLKEMLEYYYNEISKSAKLEYEKYKYAYKYIFDDKKAIVPAGFWENKLINKFNLK